MKNQANASKTDVNGNNSESNGHFLDDKGFVFIDDNNRPYWVRMWGESPWLFYWHADKRWVSFRELSGNDVLKFSANKLPNEQAEMYHSFVEV